MDKQAIRDLAERYLLGELNAAEQEKVDVQLENDQEFGKEFARYLIVAQEAKEQAEAAWKKELMTKFTKTEEAAPIVHKKKGKVLNMRWLSAVAAIFLLAIAGFWLWNQQTTPAVVYADATSEIFQARISKSDKRSGENDFVQLFENKDYTTALAVAKKEAAQADELDALLWQERQGFCLLQLGKWQEAMTVFQDLEKNTLLLPKKNPALYYQALTYLGMEDTESCKNRLRKILALPEHDYKKTAKDLLNKLGD